MNTIDDIKTGGIFGKIFTRKILTPEKRFSKGVNSFH